MTRFRFKEKYPRGRRGSPAKGVVREERSQGSNPCFSAKQNGQANSLVRFCFTTLNNRDLNESVKKTTRCVVFSGCPKAFAKHKNISHGLLCKRQEQIPVSLCSETGILHDAVHRAACGVNPGSPKCPQAKREASACICGNRTQRT